MNVTKGQWTMGSIITAAAAIVGVWVALDPWPSYGWTTPETHNADFASAVSEIKDFRDEWKCDEWDEELRDLLKEQLVLRDRDVEDSDLNEDIRRLREKIQKLNCDRFDE